MTDITSASPSSLSPAAPHLPVLIGTWAVAVAYLLIGPMPHLRALDLIDTDSFMRLVRVHELLTGTGWYDSVIHRSNAPYGETLHWTRPLDVLLAVGALLLEPFFGLEQALFWAGAAISPLLLLGVLLTFYWTVRPLVCAQARFVAALAVLMHPITLTYAMPGRADHHILVLLGFVASIGLATRSFERGNRYDRWAGAALAFALWLSTESLIAVAAVHVTHGLLWLSGDDGATRRAARQALGLTGAVALALLLERGAGFAATEYDRISIVHLLLAALIAAFWLGARRFDGAAPRTQPQRALYAATAALLVLIAMNAPFPAFLRGPLAEVDPGIGPIWLAHVTEAQPLLRNGLTSLADPVAALCLVVVLLPWMVLHRFGAPPQRAAWLLGCVAALLCLAATLYQRRFGIYLGPAGALLAAGALDRMLAAVAHRPMFRRYGFVALALLMLFLPLSAGVLAKTLNVRRPAAMALADSAESCRIAPLAGWLDGIGQGRALTIMADVDHGPELLWRTRHRVVATPYHRNGNGLLDAHEMMTATDDRVARAIAGRRGIDLVLVCSSHAGLFADKDPGTLYRRLSAGSVPEWLQPVPLPPGSPGGLSLLRVQRGAP